MQQQDDVKIGAHQLHFEPPDTLVATFSGLITLDEVKRTSELYQQTFEHHGRYYLIADIGQSHLEPAGRKYLAESCRAEWVHAIIFVGANLLQQTFGKAIALAMLFTGKSTFDTTFVKTVDEARDYVAQHRARRQRKAG
ncbi:MAG TPA: STAS/SEC14 domain-containing protein [Myxococcus sp.]|nr:STAS/SEC14 domain-containing protein [Myxococcus sp.]